MCSYVHLSAAGRGSWGGGLFKNELFTSCNYILCDGQLKKQMYVYMYIVFISSMNNKDIARYCRITLNMLHLRLWWLVSRKY